MATAGAAVAGEFWFTGENAEHEGLVVAVGGGSAWVVAHFDNGVTPGSGAEDVADVGDGVAQVVALFVTGEIVADCAASPGRPSFEEFFEDLDGCAEAIFEFLDWGETFLRFGGNFGDVVGDEVSAYWSCLLRVDSCDLAGLADGLFDHWVLTIASR